MQIILNGSFKTLKIASISTLLDVVTHLEKELPAKHLITEIKLNDKVLESNWLQNAKNIYLLDEDKLEMVAESSDVIAKEALVNSKKQFEYILEDFRKIADMFRLDDETKANTAFAQSIDNLHWYLKILEDASLLSGRNLKDITMKNKNFQVFLNELSDKLEEIIGVQTNKDWILLADLIEYELIPRLTEMNSIYEYLRI
ncbi:MAG: hypothetical protein PHR06_09075 [Candidatus Cloacimonetes bacterium]|nr:hypothetical protein [Candidatus Cloacimonadota bacterium]